MLYDIQNIQSRAANSENPLGEPSRGGLAGNGRKGAPCIEFFPSGETRTLLDADGPGVVRHIWVTFPPEKPLLLRNLILRMYWDGQENPAVECPIGDFFGIAHARKRNMENELFGFLNAKGLNCYVPMPFRRHARITVENDSGETLSMLFYQVDYTQGDFVPENAGTFHAQFRRANPQPMHTDYTILDGVKGPGRYLGTNLGVRSMRPELGWWGEGEVKFFFGGEEHPTICGTGAEDYVGFAWGLGEMCTMRSGCPVCDYENHLYSLYRLHTSDPIYFQDELKVTIQQIGCGSGKKAEAALGADFVRYRAAGVADDSDVCYYDLSDDYCSVAYWYQCGATPVFPALPDRQARSADLAIEAEIDRVRRNDL